MIRTLVWLVSGVLLGGVIHIVVILLMPAVSSNDTWSRIAALDAVGHTAVLPPVKAGEPNPLHLDPELTYAVCRLDLSDAPGLVSGTLPAGFWSLAVYDRAGTVVYSTTNRDGIGKTLDLGLFNAAQTRLLAQQQFDVPEGLLIVESPKDDVFVLVRLAVPHPAMRERFSEALAAIDCGNMEG
jgi:uncharacterized membrane protein